MFSGDRHSNASLKGRSTKAIGLFKGGRENEISVSPIP
jgi:hypothetical protein